MNGMKASTLTLHRPDPWVLIALACLLGLVVFAVVDPPGGKLVAIPDKNGQPTMQHIIPAVTTGHTRLCNGHVVAPVATGCTPSGGVVFQDATKVVK